MPPLKRSSRPIRLFCSYSHKDEALRKKLEDHLSLLKRQGFISYWHDRRIAAGTEWAGEIDDNLEAAEVILLLISTNFLASDYCYDKEMTRAMERHKAGAARVIPVILRQCDWHTASFGKLQALPKDGKAVELLKNHDAGFTNVANGIRMIVEHLGPVSHDSSDLSQPVTVTSTPQVVFLRLSTLSNENKFTARTKDLTTLTEAWDDNDVNVLILVAQGGSVRLPW